MKTHILLLVPLLVTACGGGREGAAPPEAAPIEARVAAAAVQPLPTGFEAGGIIQARTTAVISARVLAPVLEIAVEPGDRVRAGQVLARLDGRDLAASSSAAESSREAFARGEEAARAELEAATAAEALATATHARIAQLASRRSATAQELDEATTARDAAAARTRGAAMRLAQATAAVAAAREQARAAAVTATFAAITAPFDGVVTEKLIEPGNLASPGTPLLRLEDTRGTRLEVRVDESRAAQVVPGGNAEVRVDGIDRPLAGRIAEIARAVTSSAHSFLVKIDLPTDAPVRSGMFARARFEGAPRQVLAIPTDCLVPRGQLTAVFVVDAQQRARLRLVRTGRTEGALTEIVSGLDSGERVVVGPAPAVSDGSPIRAVARTADTAPAHVGGGR